MDFGEVNALWDSPDNSSFMKRKPLVRNDWLFPSIKVGMCLSYASVLSNIGTNWNGFQSELLFFS